MVALLCFGLSSCRDESSGDYVAIAGRVFIFNYRVATATYVITLDKLRPTPDGTEAVAAFENPAGGEPFRVTQPVWPKLNRIAIESPPLTCVRKDRRYAFTIELITPSGEKLQELSSSVLSTLDQSILPDAPLVIGPVYTPNPALKGNPGGKLSGLSKPPCPP